jgi:small neutral amino acid transporter SnatA (MarC family)
MVVRACLKSPDRAFSVAAVNIAKVLPLSFVMIAGPQILSAIFLATSANWRRNSAAFLTGALLSITAFVTLAYVVGRGFKKTGGSGDTLDIVVLCLLIAAGVHVFLSRKTSEPPKWMGRLQDANPRLSFTLGLLLLGIFPTDIITSWAVGSYLSNHGDPWWHSFPFVLLTMLLLAMPLTLILAFGQRAQAFLPKVRDWMNTNAWVVNEIVILFFVAIAINNIVD